MITDEISEENTQSFEGILKDITALSGALYFSQALYMIRGFIIAYLLSPSLYGIWSIFKTFFSSAPHFGLGTQQAMLRQVPLILGAGKDSNAPVIIQTSLSWNILITSFVMLIVFVFSFTNVAAAYSWEIRMAGVLFVLNAIHLFLRPLFKSEQKFLLLSKYLLFYSILNTVFGLALLFFFKLNGLLLGMIISQVIVLVYVKIKGHLTFHLFIHKKILLELFQIGFPIMILWLIIFLMGNIDKLLIFIILGKTEAGYYGLAAFISSIIGFVSYTTSSVLFPRMMYVYGKTGDKKDIEKYLDKPMVILSGLVPIILGIIYINVKMLVDFFLPQYMPAVTALHILIAALFFSTVLKLPISLLIALNKQKKFIFAALGLLVLDIILNIIVINAGYGITGAALITAATFLMVSIVSNWSALFFLKKKTKQNLKRMFAVYFPFAYLFAGLFLIVPISVSQNILIDNLLKSILFIVFSLPLIFYIEKKTGIMQKARVSFKRSK